MAMKKSMAQQLVGGQQEGLAEEVQRLRRQVLRLQAERLELQRMARLGELMAGLAHSVRSTLSLCRGATFMVDRALRQRDWDQVERAWGMVKRSSSRTAELVHALLDPEQASRVVPQAGELNAVVREVAEVAAEQARDQGDELELELADDLGGVLFDPQALRRCCVELIGNALDALAEKSGAGHLLLRTQRSPEGWILSVQDDGPGMPPELLRRVLRGGHSTKGKHGSGLGLLQVRRLVEAQGGALEVCSSKGGGTAVRCHFPASGEPSSGSK